MKFDNSLKQLICAGVVLLLGATASAQVGLGGGQLSASFETNTVYYFNDSAIDRSYENSDRFGTNNFLKLDYTYGKFSAGLQLEAYLPALEGYEIRDYGTSGLNFARKYVQWQDENFSAFVGDIYDQFGNGLIYRSYEDRQLGFNNSLEGVRATYNFGNYVAVKALYGRPRLYTEYMDSWVRGGDLIVSLADIIGWNAIMLNLEGSYINRYESIDKTGYYFREDNGLDSPHLNMYSARLNFAWEGLSLSGEYALKSNDLEQNAQTASKGAAYLVEGIYSHKTFSISATYRLLSHFGTQLSLYGQGTGNSLNYLPALTHQYTYMLANLDPNQVNTTGENAFQVDAFYKLKSKSTRSKYWNFHGNFSTAISIDGLNTLFWRDINVDAERQWGKQLKTTLLYSYQTNNHTNSSEANPYKSHILVLDVLYKFNKTYSLRGELQGLYSADNEDYNDVHEGHWVAGLLEFSIAPRWSIYVNDMYNLTYTQKNYYNAGFSYTKGRTRVQLSYGRNRAGYVCSGGVCRYSPAYTGFNVALTTSF